MNLILFKQKTLQLLDFKFQTSIPIYSVIVDYGVILSEYLFI